MKITVLQKGLMNDAEKDPKTYTADEFIAEYGTYAYDDINDTFLEFHDDEKDADGKVRLWSCGLYVEVWED